MIRKIFDRIFGARENARPAPKVLLRIGRERGSGGKVFRMLLGGKVVDLSPAGERPLF